MISQPKTHEAEELGKKMKPSERDWFPTLPYPSIRLEDSGREEREELGERIKRVGHGRRCPEQRWSGRDGSSSFLVWGSWGRADLCFPVPSEALLTNNLAEMTGREGGQNRANMQREWTRTSFLWAFERPVKTPKPFCADQEAAEK